MLSNNQYVKLGFFISIIEGELDKNARVIALRYSGDIFKSWNQIVALFVGIALCIMCWVRPLLFITIVIPAVLFYM